MASYPGFDDGDTLLADAIGPALEEVDSASISDPGVLLAGWIAQVTDTLAAGDCPGTPGQVLAAITALETLTGAAAGAQARLTVAYDTLVRDQEQADGVRASRRGRTVGCDIAAARRESPTRGTRHLGLAKALLEMPNTAQALGAGQITEWRAPTSWRRNPRR